MLYDPKWEVPAKPTPTIWTRIYRVFRPVKPEHVFDMSDFMIWAKLQPPTKTYDYTHFIGCALSLYLQDRGCKSWNSGVDRELMYRLHPRLNGALNCGGSPYTYGALAQRLERALAVE